MRRRSFFATIAGAVLFPWESIKSASVPVKPPTKDQALEALLENQRLFGEKIGDGDCNLAQFKRLNVPLIRRFYPNLIADKLMPVQPLCGAVGLIYYLREKHGI
jgi:hypothetical protein